MDNKLASTVIKQQHQPQPQQLLLLPPNSPHQEQAHHQHHHNNRQQQQQQPHHHQQQQQTFAKQNNNNDENFSHQAVAQTSPTLPLPPPPLITPQPSPKVTVSLPKHAASRLWDLVQRRDIALLKLGIISVQFEGDQIIPLTLNTTQTNSNHQTKQQQQPIASVGSIIEPSIENCNVDCISSSNKITTTTTTLTGLTSPQNGPIFDEMGKKDDEKEREGLESSKIKTFNGPIIDSSISIANVIATTAGVAATKPTTTMTTTTTTGAQSSVPIKTECNTVNNLAVVYDDEDEDDKDEEEVVSEVENQHSSSYNIHQLSQLEFADPIELEMYDNDNLLFPDYTLNLS